MTALRFQTRGPIRHPRPHFGTPGKEPLRVLSTKCSKKKMCGACDGSSNFAVDLLSSLVAVDVLKSLKHGRKRCHFVSGSLCVLDVMDKAGMSDRGVYCVMNQLSSALHW